MNVTADWKHLLSFLLIGFIVVFLFFIQSGESIYDPQQLGFYYDIYNIITEHNQRQTHYLSSILLGYSSVDSVLFYHRYFCIQYNRYFKVN